MSAAIKLSSPTTREFWEIPILYEDAHLLALDKPTGLPAAPDCVDPDRPSLVALLHAGIKRGAPWAVAAGRAFLLPAHRMDAETSGVLLLAKSKPVLVTLGNLFSAEKPARVYVALVQGDSAEARFQAEARLAPHPTRPGTMRADPRRGKRAITTFVVRERFSGFALLQCEPLTDRLHQIRVHLRDLRLPVVGDALYGGRPLLLSRLKRNYRLKPDQTERPLMSRSAVQAESLALPHPVTGEPLTITAPWPKDLTVAVKYLRRYAPA
ncbi:MAG TPA: pseudouridine synthase [Candidatus Paceibacterota bacterium]|nr:pseudouridine synthase [Verrucomicrobiota bacterium]HSA09180.1 pseudouridine synthase [Candidatus Paceibacterota bacterium]